MNTETRKCPECGKSLLGRADKKFCSDLCRHAFNNRIRSEENCLMRQTNKVLRKNRQILESQIPANRGSIKIKGSKLMALGFRFSYMTHCLSTCRGKTYHYCYDYGYLALGNDLYLLVRNTTNPDF